MAKYKCKICGYIYDEEKEGILFTDLPDDWTCPRCGVPKEMFEKLEEKTEVTSSKEEHSSVLEKYLK